MWIPLHDRRGVCDLHLLEHRERALVGVATTGRPLARYSYDLIASSDSVKGVTACGLMSTSSPFVHDGTSADITGP